MFLYRGKLDPPLTPSDYVDAGVYERERATIFAKGWNLVGPLGVLAQPGGQLALSLQDVPVVVRNEAGRLVAFRNVCPHRHSLIVQPGAHVAKSLRCQYHGWQFTGDGKLAQLPDGPSFRGFKARDACLEKFQVETLGPLVFVNLAPKVGSLEDAFGPIFLELQRHLSGLALALEQHTEHAANWKIPVENAIESYHVPLLHPRSFKTYLPEAQHEHELERTYSRYRPINPASFRERLAFVGFKWMLRGDHARRYQHIHVLPNYLISYSGIYVEIVSIVPRGVDACRRDAYGFLPVCVRGNPVSRAIDLAHRHMLRAGADSILAEDSSIWPAVHEGSRHSVNRGVLGAREERVYHFQRWVAQRLGREPQHLAKVRSTVP